MTCKTNIRLSVKPHSLIKKKPAESKSAWLDSQVKNARNIWVRSRAFLHFSLFVVRFPFLFLICQSERLVIVASTYLERAQHYYYWYSDELVTSIVKKSRIQFRIQRDKNLHYFLFFERRLPGSLENPVDKFSIIDVLLARVHNYCSGAADCRPRL